MKLRPSFKVEAEITVNDREAEILEKICSYDLLKWFATACSHQHTQEQLRDLLANVRDQCRKIVEARQRAVSTLKTDE